MAQIPMGPFDQPRVSPQVGRSNVDLRGLDAMGQAAGNLGDALQQAGGAVARIDEEQRQEAQALARAKAQNSALDDEIEQRAIADDIQQRIADGSLKYDQAQEELQTRLSMRQPTEIPGLDPVGKENYQKALNRNRFVTNNAVDGMVKTARRADFKAQIVGTRDRLLKYTSDPNADIDRIVRAGTELRALAAQGGLLDSFDKDQQDYADTAYTNNAKSRLIASRDDVAGLDKLEHDLTAEDGFYAGKLDADKRNTLLSQVQVRRAQLEAKAETNSKKGESAAERVLGSFEKQIASTIPAPDDTMLEWSETMKLGTPEQQARWNELIQDEIEVRRVLTMPPDQQRAYVQQREAEQAANGATVAQQSNLSRMKAVVERNAKDMREQPLVVYQRLTGQVVPDIDMNALLSGDTGKVQGQIAARLDTLAAMRKQYGDEVGSAPLKPQEATALAGVLNKATPAQAAQFFGTLSGLFGDRDAYRAAMQQIAPDSPVRAYAGMIFAEQRETTLEKGRIFSGAVKSNSGDVSRLLLEGEAMLNKSRADKSGDGKSTAFPMPSPKDFGGEFASTVGTAFAGSRDEAFDIAQQAVRAYYAATAARDGDMTGELDANRLKQAVRAVLGEPVDINGSDVLPPWGMGEDDFTDALEARWPSVVAHAPVGFSRDFDDYSLRAAGGSRYFIVGPGGGFLSDTAGKPVQIDVRAPLPVTPKTQPAQPAKYGMKGWRGGADIFALDTNGSRALDEEARANPLRLEDLPTPAWKGAGSAFKGLLRPGADAGRALMIAGAVVPIFDDWLTGAITGKPTDSSKDWYFRNVVDDTANSAIDYWTPGPGEMGSASKALNVGATVLGTLPQIFGTPELFLGQSALSPATEVVRQGGDVDTAAIVGGVNLAANAIGMKLPAAWGTSLQARLATGAGSNLGLGVIADAVSATALRADDMGDMAAGYDWSDPTARGLDLLMGLAFGYKAHVDAPKAMTGGQRDAVLTARNSDHLHRQTMPGEPVTPRAQAQHANTLSSAIEQVLRGEAVNVADAINPADFILRPELRPESPSAPPGDVYGQMLVALESGGRADARAPTSSATGLHQFTNGTWLRTVRGAAPAWAEGLTDAQVLAERTNPERSAEMEAALRANNAAALTRAGVDASDPFNLYAMHHFGEGKGVAFAKAAGDTPMVSILTKGQIDANPYLRGLTKDQAIANWTERAQQAGVDMRGRAPVEPDARLAMDEAASAEPARIAHPADFEADARTRTADLFNRLDAADRSAARTSAFGIQIDRKADGSYHLTDTRDHGRLSDDAQFIGRDGETMDREQAVAFMENVTQEANRQRTQAQHQPETHLDAALRLSTEAPDTPVFVGMDIDGNATYRTAGEEMADIRAEQQRAETEANAFTAAANCAIRNGVV